MNTLVERLRASTKKWLKENGKQVTLLLLAVFVIRSSLFESFKIPSGSMIPTLAVGDFIFVSKFAYGFHLPFTEYLESPVYLSQHSGPKRGDIVVFRYPRDESVYFVKRVIGLPGDRIEVREKQLYINEKPVPREALPAGAVEKLVSSGALKDPQYEYGKPEFYQEHLDGVDHTIVIDRAVDMTRNFPSTTVPADHFFAMGDNRDVSNDSRFWGFVPMRNIAGRGIVVWFSFFLSLEQQQFLSHPLRIGTLLH